MNELFFDCSSLTELPDLEKWNINNVEYADKIFYGCSSLLIIPNAFINKLIKKLNINNINDIIEIQNISENDLKEFNQLSEEKNIFSFKTDNSKDGLYSPSFYYKDFISETHINYLSEEFYSNNDSSKSSIILSSQNNFYSKILKMKFKIIMKTFITKYLKNYHLS